MRVNPYLNFDGNAAEAFAYYKSIFGGEYVTVMTMKEAPGTENMSESDKSRIMHIALPLGKDTILMASDIVPSMGHSLTVGNNVYISVSPDSREEADRLFISLSDGGKVEVPIQDQFWGDYFGSCVDRFGIGWMINYNEQYT